MNANKQIKELLARFVRSDRAGTRQLAKTLFSSGKAPEDLLIEILEQISSAQTNPADEKPRGNPKPLSTAVLSHIAELEALQHDLKNSRLAALNMMEDAVLAKESVEKNKEQLRTTLQSIGDAVISTDTAGRITTMNLAAEILTEWTVTESAGQPLETVFHIINEKSREPIENPLVEALKTGRPVQLMNHTLLITKNGSEVPIADSGAPIKNEAGKITGGVLVVRDQTQERASRNALEKSAKRLQRAQAVTRLGDWIFNLNEGTVDSSLEARKIYGLNKPVNTIAEAQQIPLPQYRKALDKAFHDLIYEGRAYDMEYQIRSPIDGAVLDIHTMAEYDPSTHTMFGTIQDITEHKQNEHLIYESRENLRTTLHSIGDAVISTDMEGRITLMNPVAETLTGWAIEESTGQPLTTVFRIINEKSRRLITDPLTTALRTGKTIQRSNHTLLITKNGSEVPIADSGAPIKNEAGKITGGVLVFRDQTQEQSAREALEKSEARYRDLFEQSADAFVLIQNGRVVDCNQATADMLGYASRKMLFNAHTIDVSPEKQPDGQLSDVKGKRIIAEMKHKRSLCFEWINKRANGEIFPTSVTLTSITDREGNQLIHAAIRDITLQKEAEKRVQFEQRLFNAFTETLPATVYFKNRKSEFVRINQHMADFFGRTREDLIGKTDYQLYPQEQADLKFEIEQRVMDLGQPIQLEEQSNDRWHMTTKAPFYDQHGKIAGTFGISFDITDRKHAEQELEASRHLLRDVIDTIPSRVWWKDLNSTFLGCNLAFAKDTGLDHPDQMIGKTDYDLCWKTEADQFIADDRKTIESGIPRVGIHEFQTQADGEIRWIETNKVPFRDNNGRIIGTVGSYTDVTERKKAEKQIADMARFPEENTNPVLRISKDGLLLYANKAADSLNQTLNANYNELVAPKWLAYIRQAFDADQPVEIEFEAAARTFAATLAPFNKWNYINVYARDITDQVESQKQIKFEQNLFHSFMETLPAAVYFKDLDGRFLRVNQSTASLCNKTAAELIGKSDAEIYPEKEAKKRLDIERQVLRTRQPIQVEEQTGNSWYLSARAPHYDRKGNPAGTFGISWDITERKHLEQAIEKRVLALTRPLDNQDDIAFEELFDLSEIQRIQDEFSAATGVASIIILSDGTPLTKPSNHTFLCQNIIRKTEKGCANCARSNARLGGHHPNGPIIQHCMSGGLRDAGVGIEVGGRLIANWIIGQVRDETQTDAYMRAYAKEIGADEDAFLDAFHNVPVMSHEHFEKIANALFTLVNQLSTSAYQNLQQARFIADEKRRTEELHRLSAAIEQSPETVMITNAKGLVEYVNPAFTKTSGYSQEEAIGQNINFLKSIKHDDEFYNAIISTISSGKTWKGRLSNQHKNGSFYTEDAAISPVRNREGQITSYVSVKRDITEELSKEDQFRQAQKMEAVGQLAGGIAHDFNNMLQAILGFSEILQRRLDPESAERLNVDEIQKAAKRAAELTRQLLTFSRKQPIQRTELNLNETVHNTEILLHVLTGKQIVTQFALSDALLPIYADHGQITQIIMNLAVNARDAMPDGGRLTISTENSLRTPANNPEGPDNQANPFVCLSITDTGCGMSSVVQERLFEPFFTTKEVGKGTGLGLSVVYGIVEQNKGKIEVSSKEGQGTTFKIFLPAHPPPSLRDGQPAKNHQPDRQQILVVENNPDVGNLIFKILGMSSDYELIQASTAEEAMELFTREKGRINLLFSLINLPGKNGIELADILTEGKPGLPVLLYNQNGPSAEQQKHFCRKEYHFIKTPFSVSNLLSKVNDIFISSIQ